MMLSRKMYFLILLFFFLIPVFSVCQPVKYQKLTNFDMQSTYIVHSGGEKISTLGYQNKNYWFPVKVPCTVLTGLVANNVYPDPYQGMNNMHIPDANDEFNIKWDLEKYSFIPGTTNPWNKPYWYRTEFAVPGSDAGKLFQLIFKGINYRAAVWVNGKQIADSSQMAGMFAEYELDVSSAIRPGKTNILAVKIFPLDYPGLPDTPQLKAFGNFFLNGGPTGDIGKNVTMLCSVGWDWMPAVRDRNMGIWQPVYLRTSGKVVVKKPKIVTALPKLPDTTIADIFLQFQLQNFSSRLQRGNVEVTITPENFAGQGFTFAKEINISPNGFQSVDLDAKSIKELAVKKPKLWWPNGHGYPNLYRARIRFVSHNQVLDDTSVVFGIRTISSTITTIGNFARRDFYVNGKKVFLTGGAWVPDMMLNRDSARYAHEIQLCQNSNMNLLRIWGGGVTPPDVFFDLADRYGMLVWNDFWVTGDTQGEFKGSPDWPLDENIFIRNMTSTIYRIRNHASLLLWTGGNEGHARKILYDAMRDSVIALDGTRPFIPSSSGYAKLPAGWKGSWPDNGPPGVYSSGPYSWQDPHVYYTKVAEQTDWLFKDETGIPSQPPYASLGKIIPNLIPDPSIPYPLNNTWGYHDACSGNGHYELYYQEALKRYGDFTGMKDFSDKMQLMNADGYRGIFEAASSRLKETGGIMLWKINAAFPSVIWQVYDWYLRPNAGYYFMKRAIAPVTIQLNLNDSAVAIVNRNYFDMKNLSVEIEIFDLNGKRVLKSGKNISVNAEDVLIVESLAHQLKPLKGIHFVHLSLYRGKNLLSSNTYWMERNNDFKNLVDMPEATISVREVRVAAKNSLKTPAPGNRELFSSDQKEYVVKNISSQMAFFINFSLQDASDNEEILPSYWSDNYFSLNPGEERVITFRCDKNNVPKKFKLVVDGWNLKGVE